MRKRVITVNLSVSIAIVLFIIYMYLYVQYGVGIPCLFNEITDLYCPGCGTTRAITAFCRGDYVKAFRYNPILLVWFPYLLCFGIILIREYIYDESATVKTIKRRNGISILVLVIICFYWLIRNMSFASFLRPDII